MEIVGHKKQQNFLKQAAKLDKISHAYLFFGPKHIGKKATAIEFIKLLNCEKKQACGKCRPCMDIERGMHPDFIIVEPDKDASSKEIKISQIKKLQRELSLCSYQSHIKSVIIDESECMNKEAQNCFLKTLEEPSGKTLLILIAEHPEMLLPTILSRTERIKFSPSKNTEIENHLKKQGASASMAKEIAAMSEGKLGVAVELFLNPEKLLEQKKKIREIVRLCSADIAFRFQYAKNLSSRPQELLETLDIWTRYLRNIFLYKLEAENSLTEMPIEFKNYTILKLKNILKTMQDINSLITGTNVNHRLALEMLMTEL